jgi:hypothetical protein
MPVKRGVGRESRTERERCYDDLLANYGETLIGDRAWPILPLAT